ncbi:GTP 3',8-cyclase MoaA [Tenacibaculum finnmarkense]|uniref:GTP 3',8-cyclase MoaA n=1 Tax=Tenacibaculum finnmarkense TaxID=2781243 RepID=UPI00187B3C3E|nr:GTP 3',8-cyclase MoaA [Tenacibaculum finnmarkense]MBE7692178.1 GTP 3',8-cyclase MoaA [Tenacibaculum finnmarkense genomovar finnmarkense]MCG8805174.1 GTP 3',8-cyclase MoaA [Tenacibaculum finnmarkense]MCG8855397.1 GTP 3',8-cyclase MoaA [Tenacibaculum finnmarkense]
MHKLIDNFGRQINYVRLAVTDRCNLRCQYCMPAHGIDIVPRKELLTYKEMYRLIRVLTELGVNKVRLTGGEPFARKDFMSFLEMLSYNDLLDEINITTNGALISEHIETLEKLDKVKNINLSLDSLNTDKFAKITRRDVFPEVYKTFELLEKSSLNLKLNVVIQAGFNTDEINDFVGLTKDKNIAIRFIEEMPFNGKGQRNIQENWNYNKILEEIKSEYSVENIISEKSSTSRNFSIKNHQGTVGIIPAFTRTICNDCNRIRITSTGTFKNCLFDDGVFNLRDFIRNGASNDDLKTLFLSLIKEKPENGFIAEANRKQGSVSESMSTIGG